MVSESRGFEFDPVTHILMHVIIPAYKSLYCGAHVAQTSRDEILTDT
jgi:hypothetical protein